MQYISCVISTANASKNFLFKNEKECFFMEVGTTQSGPENAWVQLAQIGKEGSYYISCPNGQGYLAGQLKKLGA